MSCHLTRSGVVIVLSVLALLAFIPVLVRAEGTAADAMCVTVEPQCPPCGPLFDPQKGKCIKPGRNQFNCPDTCKDNTNGGITSGHCVTVGKCHGDKYGEAAGQPGGAAGLDQLMKAL